MNFVSFNLKYVRYTKGSPSEKSSILNREVSNSFKSIADVMAFEKAMVEECKQGLGRDVDVRVSVITWRAFDSPTIH